MGVVFCGNEGKRGKGVGRVGKSMRTRLSKLPFSKLLFSFSLKIGKEYLEK